MPAAQKCPDRGQAQFRQRLGHPGQRVKVPRFNSPPRSTEEPRTTFSGRPEADADRRRPPNPRWIVLAMLRRIRPAAASPAESLRVESRTRSGYIAAISGDSKQTVQLACCFLAKFLLDRQIASSRRRAVSCFNIKNASSISEATRKRGPLGSPHPSFRGQEKKKKKQERRRTGPGLARFFDATSRPTPRPLP